MFLILSLFLHIPLHASSYFLAPPGVNLTNGILDDGFPEIKIADEKGRVYSEMNKQRYDLGVRYKRQAIVIRNDSNIVKLFCNDKLVAVHKNGKTIRTLLTYMPRDRGRFNVHKRRYQLPVYFKDKEIEITPLVGYDWSSGFIVFHRNIRIAEYLSDTDEFVLSFIYRATDHKGRFNFYDKRYNLGTENANKDVMLIPHNNSWLESFYVLFLDKAYMIKTGFTNPDSAVKLDISPKLLYISQ